MRIGIDLGGTKIELVVLDDSGAPRHRTRVPTPSGDYDAVLSTLVQLIGDAERNVGVSCSIGLGTPGAPSARTGLMKNSNSLCLNGQPLQRDLEARLSRPIRLQNDANCLALSEAMDGAGRDADVVFAVILGTGTGGGVVVNKRVLTGANAIAGEWGHNPLPWPTDDERPGAACYCGKHGCIETFLSGPGLARDHERVTGHGCSAEAIAEAAAHHDPAALATLERYYDRCARALATCINLLDPQTIVLGGGVSKLSGLYEEVPKRWGRYVFSDQVGTRLLPALHGDASGVRGAAWLWP